ncbi:hypothetical protein K501DRAFT_330090 [Backusella circina FSU 941]|nr:hypothetical protein K501DRAFT_330090 [Backusella circina FSU 941]
MSGYLSNDDSELVFDKRTTNAVFQKRLLEAQKQIEDELEDEFDLEEFGGIQSQEELQKEFDRLTAHVEKNKAKIKNLEKRLLKRQEKRKLDAAITNLTPSERAERLERELQYLEEHGGEEEKEPEMDMLFDYIVFLSTDSAAGDLSKADIIKEHVDIRKRALQDQSVIKENQLMDLCFDDISNEATHNTHDDTTIRQCHFSGTSCRKPFSVSFKMTEPAKVISDLSFDVGIEMQMDIGTLLELIKEECDVLAFFRTLTHYSKLESQRKNTIEKWQNEYDQSSITVEILSESKLKFQDEGNNNLYLLFEWKIVERGLSKQNLDTDVIENVMPLFELEAMTHLEDGNIESDNVTDELMSRIKQYGVFSAVDFFIRGILN